MTETTITLVAALLAFAASIIATAVAAYNGRFRKFARERWWERQAEVYTRIIEALAGMVYYHEEHLTAYEEGRNVPEALKTETVQHWRRSYAELKKASAVGAFLMSPEAEAALQKMWKDKDNTIDPQDWYGQLEQDYVAARDCLKRMVKDAERDLETHRREALAPVRRGRRKFAAVVAANVIGGGRSLGTLRASKRAAVAVLNGRSWPRIPWDDVRHVAARSQANARRRRSPAHDGRRVQEHRADATVHRELYTVVLR